ncbi:MAG: hypothetical protein CMP59_12685 [Flavobacteriales bacterium]|nr:hypothetical protein [Flavobacteriales bacterium]
MKNYSLLTSAASILLAFTLTFIGGELKAQQGIDDVLNNGEIRGNFQLEAQYYQEDSLIGAQDVPEKILSNGFLNLIYTNGSFSMGVRYESYLNALLGFPEGYRGNGVTYRFASFTQEKMSVTVGNFYEQFGNGLIFRTYEERGLGYDNMMDGVRVKFKPAPGLSLTGITGKQRLFFEYGEGIVRGLDAEFYLNDGISALANSKTQIILGASGISKYQPDQDSRYVLPENVGAVAGRVNITHGFFNVNAEYAWKANDPSADNGYIYRPGEALFVQASYSRKGFGLVLAAKRNDNMSFRSDRTEGQQNLLINYLPALTKQHTYNLLATLYPYAVQLNGEVAFQADLIYKFDKGSVLGGKYGMDVQFNVATANNIDTTMLNDERTTRQGYTSDWFKRGELYFQDINTQITKKFSKKVKGRFTYANLIYNQDVIEGKPGVPVIRANVGIADVTYKFNMRNSLRTEVQFLLTEQDQGDWATAIFEYSYAPHWFFAIMDQYNYGNEDPERQIHYYNASMGYNNGGNRITLSYGRQRAGIFCVGGVCRVVPASSGLYLSLTSSF